MCSAVLFVLASLLACSYAQCSLENAVYAVGNDTFVFGAAVGGWIPALHHYDDVGVIGAWFLTVTQATSTRFELLDAGYYGRAAQDCKGMTGQYSFMFSPDCTSLTLSTIFDECDLRTRLYDGLALTMTVSTDGCNSLNGVLMETTDSPKLSGERVSIIQAPSDLAIVSIGSYTAIFQQWGSNPDQPANYVRVQDLLSVPPGYACAVRFYGQYFLTKGDGCTAIMCGDTDSCAARGHLFHGLMLNGYSGPVCASDITILDYPNNACSNGNIWTQSPYDCRDQFGGAQCMFCHGVANGKDVRVCLDRNGGICNDIFRSLPSKGWCNLEMECPASVLSLSVFALLLMVLVALF